MPPRFKSATPHEHLLVQLGDQRHVWPSQNTSEFSYKQKLECLRRGAVWIRSTREYQCVACQFSIPPRPDRPAYNFSHFDKHYSRKKHACTWRDKTGEEQQDTWQTYVRGHFSHDGTHTEMEEPPAGHEMQSDLDEPRSAPSADVECLPMASYMDEDYIPGSRNMMNYKRLTPPSINEVCHMATGNAGAGSTMWSVADGSGDSAALLEAGLAALEDTAAGMKAKLNQGSTSGTPAQQESCRGTKRASLEDEIAWGHSVTTSAARQLLQSLSDRFRGGLDDQAWLEADEDEEELYLEDPEVEVADEQYQQPLDMPAAAAGDGQVHEECPRHELPKMKRRNVSWYITRKDEPICPGSPVSILSAAFTFLTIKVEHAVSDIAFDLFMKAFAYGLSHVGGEDNAFPRSFHIMKAIVRVRAAEDFEWHMCPVPSCGLRIQRTAQKEWSTETRCACCKSRLYRVESGHVQPIKRCWDFGLANVLRDMWAEPEFRQAWCSRVDYDDPATFHGSKHYHALEQDYPWGFLRHGQPPMSDGAGPQYETMHIQGGGDGLNMHIFGAHSAQVYGVRCEDLPPDLCMTQLAWRILLIVEGPKECTNLDSVVSGVVDELMKYSPVLSGTNDHRGQALQVFPGAGPEDPPRELHVCLSGNVGDVPWTAVLARACGHSSFRGCLRCFQLGVTCNVQGESLGCVRFMGYLDPSKAQVLEIDEQGKDTWRNRNFCLSVMDKDGNVAFNSREADANKVTNVLQRSRAEGAAAIMRDAVAARPIPEQQAGQSLEEWEAAIAEQYRLRLDSFNQEAGAIGCKGMSEFSRLPYYRFDRFWHFPLGHVLLYGCCKTAWQLFLSPAQAIPDCTASLKISTVEQAKMSSRVSKMRSTASVSCKLPNVVKDKGNMTMEQWALFVGELSPAVLYDVHLPDRVRLMWSELRKGLVYFCTYRKGQHRKELWTQARAHLLRYARMAEEYTRGHALLTVQLHTAVVHLVDFVEWYGPAAFRGEFWVERMVQLIKRMTKHRLGKRPEQTAVTCLLTRSACNVVRRTHPSVVTLLNTVDLERKPEATAPHDGGTYRDSMDCQGVCLTDPGMPALAQERQLLCNSIWDYATGLAEIPQDLLSKDQQSMLRLRDVIDDGYTNEDNLQIYMFKSASVEAGRFCIRAKPQQRAKKEDCWVLVPSLGDDGKYWMQLLCAEALVKVMWTCPDTGESLEVKLIWGESRVANAVDTQYGSTTMQEGMWETEAGSSAQDVEILPSLLRCESSVEDGIRTVLPVQCAMCTCMEMAVPDDILYVPCLKMGQHG